jgi:SAM-dependent methyltransferase
MAMNLLHRIRCSSDTWAKTVNDRLMPWVLDDVELGPRTLEIGPGYGATTRVLVDRATSLTAVEVDGVMAERLDRLYGDRVRVIHGDGTKTGLPDGDFSSVVCFTMLHHVPSSQLQDRLLAEAFRVLAPGGVFAGSDGVPSFSFRLKHIGDTYNPIPTADLETRLRKIGFTAIKIEAAGTSQRWRATKPR